MFWSSRLRGVCATLCGALLALGATANAANAGWSPKLVTTAPVGAQPALAVNGNGEVALAWAIPGDFNEKQRFRTRVFVSFANSRGVTSTREIWSSEREFTKRIAVGIDEQGVATVAWESVTRRQFHVPRRQGTLRVAYGARTWSPVRVLARSGEDPQLALAPGGEVLLSWTGAKRAAVAFRAPGKPFGRPQVLEHPRLPTLQTFNAVTPAFDAAGTAYLTTPCDATVARALPGSRRFTTATVLAHGAVSSVHVGVTGAGDGIASWVAGACAKRRADSYATPGPLYASVLKAGVFGAPVALTPPNALVTETGASLPAAGGGGRLAWIESVPFEATVSADGTPSPATLVRGLRTLFTIGAGGDVVLSDYGFGGPPFGTDVIVRPVDGGPDALSPLVAGLFAVAPTGRAFAMLTGFYGAHLHYAIWRPAVSSSPPPPT